MKQPKKLKTHARLSLLPDFFWKKEFWEKEYIENELSLPAMKKKYNISFSDTLYFLDWFDIPRRTIKNGQTNRVKKQRSETNLKIYGHVNCLGKNTSAYLKRNKTVKEKYGVDNVFQLQEVINKINTKEATLKRGEAIKRVWESKTEKEREEWLVSSIHQFKTFEEKEYLEYCESISKRNKLVWESKTKKERKAWLDKSIRGEFTSANHKCFKSSLEVLFESFLDTYNFNYVPQYAVQYQDSYFYYDIYLVDYNLIIEINGDYWHCNPLYYKETDIVNYPNNIKKCAKAIWDKDKIKQDYITSKKYDLLVIWEKEINENKHNLSNFFKNKLNEKIENKKNRKS